MSTPAKKAVPSLAELTNKKDNDSTVENEQSLRDQLNKSNIENDDLRQRLESAEKQIEELKNSKDIRKTPNELSAETPDETHARYGIDTKITAEDADNPRVQVYRDTHVNEVPSGTHLHPDIAKDLMNRGITYPGSDAAIVTRTVYDYDYADPPAEVAAGTEVEK